MDQDQARLTCDQHDRKLESDRKSSERASAGEGERMRLGDVFHAHGADVSVYATNGIGEWWGATAEEQRITARTKECKL